MALPQRVVDGESRSVWLRHLGVPEGVLDAAMRRAYRSYVNRDPHWPAQTAGTMLWSDGLAELRAGLTRLQWLSSAHKNVESILSPDGRIRLVWMRGTAETGDLFGRPRSQREHGPAVRNLLSRSGRLELFGEDAMRSLVRPGTEAEHAKLWVMLVYPGKRELRAELSQPTASRDGVITSFGPRIPLLPVRRDELYGGVLHQQSRTSTTAAISVEVQRRPAT